MENICCTVLSFQLVEQSQCMQSVTCLVLVLHNHHNPATLSVCVFSVPPHFCTASARQVINAMSVPWTETSPKGIWLKMLGCEVTTNSLKLVSNNDVNMISQ